MSVRKLAALAWALIGARWAYLGVLQPLLTGVGTSTVLMPVVLAIDAAVAWRVWAGLTARPLIAAVLWGVLWLASFAAIVLNTGLTWALEVVDWLGLLLVVLATALSLAALVRPMLAPEEPRPPT